MKTDNVLLQKELINKIVAEFPHLKIIAENINKSDGLIKQNFEKNFAQAASNLTFSYLSPLEIKEIMRVSKVKL